MQICIGAGGKESVSFDEEVMWGLFWKQSTAQPSPSPPVLTGQPELLTQKSSCAALFKKANIPSVLEGNVGRCRAVSPQFYTHPIQGDSLYEVFWRWEGAELFLFKVWFAWQIGSSENLGDDTFICKQSKSFILNLKLA